ncbi:MAG: DsbA family protein, partial [Aggregatilineales bacterium]
FNSAYAGIPQTRTEDGAYVLGFEDAPITIVAFEDFLCPHCQRYQAVLQPFIEQYVVTGQAKFEFRMLATQQISNVVMGLAQCAETARPGTFWDAHDLLFELASEVEQFDETTVVRFADDLSVATSDLAPCATTTTQHQVDQQLAAEMGVGGTPTVMVRYADGELVYLPDTRTPSLEELAAIVEAAQ